MPILAEEMRALVLEIQDQAERLEEVDADVAVDVFVAEWSLPVDREEDVGVLESVPGQLEPGDLAHGDLAWP